MAETNVELIFGTKAGVVWRALNQNGPSNIGDLVKSTSMSREEVYSALGWLGREGKIIVEQKGRAMIFSLRNEEALLPMIEETEIAESEPKIKSKSRKGKPSKKTEKARKVKIPVKQTENPANHSGRVEEFLLH
jgi:DNA-binding transcriptional ArsR family regulator